MREILFRAKRIDNGEWVEGFYVNRFDVNEEIEHLIFWRKSYTVWEYAKIDPETLCQFTGSNDKNGNCIWENDIVSGYFNHKKITGFIKYGSNAVYYIEREGSYGIHLDNSEDWLEVIGNIFDNPELLKGE